MSESISPSSDSLARHRAEYRQHHVREVGREGTGVVDRAEDTRLITLLFSTFIHLDELGTLS
jgi:hypothetical protein